MELATLLRIGAALACPIGMGLMMWWIMKGMRREQTNATTAQLVSADRVAALRAQRRALEAEIAETARLAEIETKPDLQSQTLALKDTEVTVSPTAGR